MFPLAPWHMWGGTQRVDITPAAGVTTNASLQLAKVSYKRPETWSFFFGVSLLGQGDSSDTLAIRVYIDIILGVGRSSFQAANQDLASFPQFARFGWNLVAPYNLGAIPKKWTTVGSRVQLDDLDATDTTRPEWLVAQDIQATARLGVTAETTEPTITAEVSAFFAPRSHVRPDWFREEFRGHETGGT